jgi:hypothetical protein
VRWLTVAALVGVMRDLRRGEARTAANTKLLQHRGMQGESNTDRNKTGVSSRAVDDEIQWGMHGHKLVTLLL